MLIHTFDNIYETPFKVGDKRGILQFYRVNRHFSSQMKFIVCLGLRFTLTQKKLMDYILSVCVEL